MSDENINPDAPSKELADEAERLFQASVARMRARRKPHRAASAITVKEWFHREGYEQHEVGAKNLSPLQ